LSASTSVSAGPWRTALDFDPLRTFGGNGSNAGPCSEADVYSAELLTKCKR
jgi:hypothetical protein